MRLRLFLCNPSYECFKIFSCFLLRLEGLRGLQFGFSPECTTQTPAVLLGFLFHLQGRMQSLHRLAESLERGTLLLDIGKKRRRRSAEAWPAGRAEFDA